MTASYTPPPAFGRFRVLHQVGAGTLGPVFRGHDPDEGRLVAIKVFRLDITPEKAAELAAALKRVVELDLVHPGIVPPREAGVEGTVAYLASDYVSADSLDAAVRQYGPAPFQQALNLLTRLGGALDFAAAVGAFHGALHSRDILVSPDECRMTGIGIAGALEKCGLGAAARRPFSAPERLEGAPPSRRSDVYSLAACAHELLTGRRPVPLDDRLAVRLEGLDADLEALTSVFTRAFAVDPAERHSSALELVTAFDEALGKRARPAEMRSGEAGDVRLRDEGSAAVADIDSMRPPEEAVAERPQELVEFDRLLQSQEPFQGEIAFDRLQDEGTGDLEQPQPPEPEASAGDEIDAIVRRAVEAAGGEFDEMRPREAGGHDEVGEMRPPEAGGGDGVDEMRPLEADGHDDFGDMRRLEAGGYDDSGETQPLEAGGYGDFDEMRPVEAGGYDDVDEMTPLEAGGRAELARETTPPEARGREEIAGVAGEIATPGEGGRAGLSPETMPRDAGGRANAGETTPLEAGAPRGDEELMPPRATAGHVEPPESLPLFERETAGPPPEEELPGAAGDSYQERRARAVAPRGHVRSRRSAGPVLLLMLMLGILVGFVAGYVTGVSRVVPSIDLAAGLPPGTRPEPSETQPTPSGTQSEPSGTRSTPPGAASQPGTRPGASETGPPPAAPVASESATRTPAPIPPPARGAIEVRSTPPGARILLNGEARGSTPATIRDLDAGRYSVELSMPGYVSERRQVTLAAGESAERVAFTLRRPAAPPTPPATTSFVGSMLVESRPSGAEVLLDGKSIGKTPLKVPGVGAGSHVVRLQLPGHRPWTASVTVTAGRQATVRGSLEPERLQ